MPLSVEDPVIGGIAFAATKLIGYCLAAGLISKLYQRTPPRWWLIGVSRTLIGVAFGYPYFHWASSGAQNLGFILGLVPIRLIEWLLLVVIFYDRKLTNRARALEVASAGTGWSFALDIPAILGYFLVGGFWIC